MSMHEIEDMVSDAVEILHRHDGGDDLRDLFHSLYAFQARFDTGFTHGRVLDVLVERRFVLKFDVACHPRLPGNETRFSEAARSDSISFIGSEVLSTKNEDIENEVDDEDDGDEAAPASVGHEEGFLCDGALFCEVGTALWHELVARGVVTGSDAVPVRALAFSSLILRICRAAQAGNEPLTAAAWFDLGPNRIFAEQFVRQVEKGEVLGRNPFSGKDIVASERALIPVPPTPEQLDALPEARALRDIARAMDLDSVDLPYSTRPAREERRDFERWWWGA
jgi:hypothetical protein